MRGTLLVLTALQEGRVEITEEWNSEWDEQMQVDRKEDGSSNAVQQKEGVRTGVREIGGIRGGESAAEPSLVGLMDHRGERGGQEEGRTAVGRTVPNRTLPSSSRTAAAAAVANGEMQSTWNVS